MGLIVAAFIQMIRMLGYGQDGVRPWEAGHGLTEEMGKGSGNIELTAQLEPQEHVTQGTRIQTMKCQAMPGRGIVQARGADGGLD